RLLHPVCVADLRRAGALRRHHHSRRHCVHGELRPEPARGTRHPMAQGRGPSRPALRRSVATFFCTRTQFAGGRGVGVEQNRVGREMIERRKVLKGIGLTIGGASVASPAILRHAFAQSPAKVSIKGVYSSPGLSFAAIFLADRAGLWAANGLEAEVKQVQGGPLAMVALTNREAQFAGVASTDPVIGWDKGVKTLTISAFTGALDMQMTARNDWMARGGVSPKSPLEGKLKALKGARVGASTIAGGPAQYTRYLART